VYRIEVTTPLGPIYSNTVGEAQAGACYRQALAMAWRHKGGAYATMTKV